MFPYNHYICVKKGNDKISTRHRFDGMGNSYALEVMGKILTTIDLIFQT